MSYNIKNINTHLYIKDIGSHKYYFLDANVWFDYLAFADSGKIDKEKQPYLDFFDVIIQIQLLNIQGVNHKPKIIMTSSLMQEIITSYLFRHAKNSYCNRKSKEQSIRRRVFVEYKMSNKEYRNNRWTDYSAQLKKVIKRIMDYSKYISFWSETEEEFSASVFGNLLSQFSSVSHCDFNDYYYYHMCVKKDMPIVTNDGDFAFKGIKVITNNSHLLSLV